MDNLNMDNSWKKQLSDKFAPIIGIEKTEELISSIQTVFSNKEHYEEALIIIDYLIDLSESNNELREQIIQDYKNLNIDYIISVFVKELFRICTFGFICITINYNLPYYIYILLLFPMGIELIIKLMSFSLKSKYDPES
jgi:hypothetical protein